MIKSIHIQNYKSLKDCTVHLEQVNLLIGANNSGKSNFMNAFVLFGQFAMHFLNKRDKNNLITKSDYFKNSVDNVEKKLPDISFELTFERKFIGEFNILLGWKGNFSLYFAKGKSIKDIKSNIDSSESVDDLFEWGIICLGGPNSLENYLTQPNPYVFSDSDLENIKVLKEFLVELSYSNVFKPLPGSFSNRTDIPKVTDKINKDGSNIIPFLQHLSQKNRPLFQQLESDFRRCVKEFIEISTPSVPDKEGLIQLVFRDINRNEFLANEVSEGVLYFLAILCLIHQPNPSKLILVEEPETGIHPRRIHEIMNFIFQLADEKGIQVIISSHSPLVLGEFKDIPEAVHVFDKENGETIIKNLKTEIIEPKNKKLADLNLKPIDYTEEIGENWLMGMLDGVPND